MSNSSSLFRSRRPAEPVLPRGEAVAEFETYGEAQQAVDTLVRLDFNVKDVTIIGNDLKSVERVTGRLTWGRVAGAGAVSGLWLGLFFGVLLIVFTPTANYAFIAGAALIGAAFGMLFAIGSYALTRRIRDFTSTREVIASSYSILVKTETSARARSLLNVDQPLPVAPIPNE
jgi:uncharacterized membrane protein